MGNGGRIIRIGFRTYSGKAKEIQSTDQSIEACSESQRIADQNPLNTDQPDRNKTQIDGRQQILLTNHASIEKGQRRSHYHHKSRGNENPGCISSINLFHNPFSLGIIYSWIRFYGDGVEFPLPLRVISADKPDNLGLYDP